MSAHARRMEAERVHRTRMYWHAFAAMWWTIGYVASHPDLDRRMRIDRGLPTTIH